MITVLHRYAVGHQQCCLKCAWFKYHRSWLLPVLTTTDMQLLHTAGLDSLMLNWLNTIGMQIFLPIAVLGLGACKSPSTMHLLAKRNPSVAVCLLVSGKSSGSS